jgi:hypothetical protein
LLHGKPGAAKTAAATTLALTCNVPVVIVETEMRPIRMLERMAAAHSATYISDFLDGTLSVDQIADLMAETAAAYPLVGFVDGINSPVTASEIADITDKWRNEHQADTALGIVDSLQSWALQSLGSVVRDEYERTNAAITQIVQASARAFFLIISERANAGSQASDAHGKGSGRTGYANELAIGLDVTGPYDKMTGFTPINATIAKNRWGRQGVTIPLWFHGRTQRFFDSAEPHGLTGRKAAVETEIESPQVVQKDRTPDGFSDAELFGQ